MPAQPLLRSNLRTVTIVVLLLAFVALAFGQWISARWLYGGSFEAAERRDALARARLTQSILRDRADFLSSNALDNATWNASYRFMRGQNDNHLRQEFIAEGFHRQHIWAFAYISPDGRLVAAQQYDPELDRFVAIDGSLRQALGRRGAVGSRLSLARNVEGFARVSGMLYAWGAAPIVRSDGSGPPDGFLVLLGRLDKTLLQSVTRTVDSLIELRDRTVASGGFIPAHVPLEAVDAAFSIRDDATLEIRFSMAPLDDTSVLEVSVLSPRAMHAAETRSSRYFLWSTLAFGTLLSAAAVWFVERRLLRPVQAASEGLVRIGRSGDLSARLATAPRQDQIGALVGAANDMLARLESQRGAEAARDAAVTASRLKSEFLARMSHEIRTPMNGVLGTADLLAATDLTQKQRRFLDIIHRSAKSLLGVINDILDFSRVEAGHLALQRVEFDPCIVVEETVEMLGESAHRKGLELVVAVDPLVPARVFGDPARLRQILTNLVGNAVKFTGHGRVTVQLLARRQTGGSVLVECVVSDTGIGIAPDALERIFESFGQADTSITRRFGGTGLGLPIARHLARLMGGDILVSSVAGKGSTFTMTAMLEVAPEPCDRAGVAPPLDAAWIPAPNQASRWPSSRDDSAGAALSGAPDPGPRVLLVEDNAINREVAVHMLSAMGCGVLVAENGREAISLFEAHGADIILMDVQMPVLDGIAATAEIRRREAARGARSVPIIAITANAMEKDQLECRAAGMNGFVSKPFSMGQLEQVLSQFWNESDLARGVAPASSTDTEPVS